jgi:hypothetical protein
MKSHAKSSAPHRWIGTGPPVRRGAVVARVRTPGAQRLDAAHAQGEARRATGKRELRENRSVDRDQHQQTLARRAVAGGSETPVTTPTQQRAVRRCFRPQSFPQTWPPPPNTGGPAEPPQRLNRAAEPPTSIAKPDHQAGPSLGCALGSTRTRAPPALNAGTGSRPPCRWVGACCGLCQISQAPRRRAAKLGWGTPPPDPRSKRRS